MPIYKECGSAAWKSENDIRIEKAQKRFDAELEARRKIDQSIKDETCKYIQGMGGDDWLNSLIEHDPSKMHDRLVDEDTKNGIKR
jgi:hypothetical protein